MVMVRTFFFVFTLHISFFLISMDRSYSRIRLSKRNSLSMITTSISEEFSRLRDQPSPLRNSSPKPVARESSPRTSKKNLDQTLRDSPPNPRALVAALIETINAGDMNTFNHYMQHPLDINGPDTHGRTALEVASEKLEAARGALEAFENLKKEELEKIKREELEKRKKETFESMKIQCEMMLCLLKLPSCNIGLTLRNGQTVLHCVCHFFPDMMKHYQLTLAQELLNKKVPLEIHNLQGKTPLHNAVTLSHNITLIQKLVHAGACNRPDLSADRTTPLDEAVWQANPQWVDILLQAPDLSYALLDQALRRCKQHLNHPHLGHSSPLPLLPLEERKRALQFIERVLEQKKKICKPD